MSRVGRFVTALAVAAALVPLVPTAAGADHDSDYRRIHFPVGEAVSFSNDFGAPRSGGRSHMGVDLFGRKLAPLLATVDGTVTFLKADSSGLSGNMVTIRDSSGWSYRYMHVNNDSPDTDDGLNPTEWQFAPGLAVGSPVGIGQLIGFLGDSGNAETTPPHLHFEIRRPDGSALNPWTSLRLALGQPAGTRCAYNRNPHPEPSEASGAGYYVLGDDGGIFSFAVPFHGSVPGLGLGSPVKALRLETTTSGGGYWILGADGGVFSFGDARFLGSVPGLRLGSAVTAVDLQRTASGAGYWVLGADGGIFSFGDAQFHGSLPGIGVGARAIRLVPTPTGRGYWILGADGGVFSFGDAQFHGSVPGLGVATRVVAMSAAPGRDGYWILGADGGVFSFGGVAFHGSVPGIGWCRWPHGVQMSESATGAGYWVVGEDGSVFSFGDSRFLGSVPAVGLGVAVRAIDIASVAPNPTQSEPGAPGLS